MRRRKHRLRHPTNPRTTKVNGESCSEDLKTPSAMPRGKLGSYPFPFQIFKIVYLVNYVHTILKRKKMLKKYKPHVSIQVA